MRAITSWGALWALSFGCNPAPAEPEQQVGYRDGVVAGEPNSSERGTIKISEVLWSGSVDGGADWDPSDVFIELRNESNRPVNVSRWRIVMDGSHQETWILPDSDREIGVDEHVFIAATDSRCFPTPDFLLPDLEFQYGDPFRLTLLDSDERLVEPIGSEFAPPFAGGYDGQLSRSMERVQLMFGGEGSTPHSWHFYSEGEIDVPNDDRIAGPCRERTRASPGRPNSPDYSGAFATGSFE
jgi:hypothetical protein